MTLMVESISRVNSVRVVVCKTHDCLSLRIRGNNSFQYQSIFPVSESFSRIELCCPVEEGFEVRAGVIHLSVCKAVSSLVRVVRH